MDFYRLNRGGPCGIGLNIEENCPYILDGGINSGGARRHIGHGGRLPLPVTYE
jgi:hypothetical protein